MGGFLASLDGYHPEAIDYGSARLGNRMASVGRAPMDIQAVSAVIAAAWTGYLIGFEEVAAGGPSLY